MGVWNGWFVCDMYFYETCVWIIFDAWFCLVRNILMETDYCSILKGEAKAAQYVGCNTQHSETDMSGSGYGHTYVIVNIAVCL